MKQNNGIDMQSKKDPLVSIVIPVYKVEKYLKRCVESILSQSYKNMEIILVDDGSPDQCGVICDEYAERDERIVVIHKENGGLSDARNAGTMNAAGEYITYVDSDDWIDRDYVNLLLKALIENDASLAVCRIKKLSKEEDNNTNNSDRTMVFSTEQALETMLYQKEFDNSACGKLYYTELMKKHLFPVGKLFEDLFTTYKVIGDCSKIAYIDDQLYFYWTNPNSIMHKSFNPRVYDEIEAADEIVDYITNNFLTIIDAGNARRFSAYSQVFFWIPQKCSVEDEKKKREIWSFIKQYRVKMIFDNKARMKNRLAAAVACFGSSIYRMIGQI